MNITLQQELRRPAKFLKTFFKWSLCAILVGVLCGLIGTAFHYSVALAASAFRAHGWLLYLLPAAGLLIVLGYHLCRMDEDPGTNLVIRSIRTPEKTRLVIAPLIFVGTTLTHLCGGSSGREGAALQIGGSVGTYLGQLFRFEEKDLHVMTMCGMAALFSHLETACGLTFVLSASCSWVSPALCRSCLIFCPSSISFGSPFRTRFVFGSDAMMIPRDGAGCNNVSFMSPQLPVERQPMVERQPAAGWERSEKNRKKPVFPVARRGRCVL